MDITKLERQIEEQCQSGVNFKWNMVNQITSINLVCEMDDNCEDVLMAYLTLIANPQEGPSIYLNLKFKNVSNLNLDNYGRQNQMLGFEIIDCKKRGWGEEHRYMIMRILEFHFFVVT